MRSTRCTGHVGFDRSRAGYSGGISVSTPSSGDSGLPMSGSCDSRVSVS